MTVKHDCSGRVSDRELRGMIYSCQRPATVQRDGKWWCWQHDPERVKADEKKRRAGWEAKMDREAFIYARIARNARLAELVTPELAELLEKVANATKGWSSIGFFTSQDGGRCRELAAQIRQVLTLEANDED